MRFLIFAMSRLDQKSLRCAFHQVSPHKRRLAHHKIFLVVFILTCLKVFRFEAFTAEVERALALTL